MTKDIPGTDLPLTEPISGDEYMQVLLQRQAAWLARNGGALKFPPLLEWFVQDGDEQWVQLTETEPAPKKERKPRVYRSAASLREERDNVAAKLDALTAEDTTDGAVVNLSPNSRSKSAARAGRRRFAKMDRDLQRYTTLRNKLALLNSRVATAEAREKRAA
ncbi:hypothetical protein AB0383_20465 [Amycolatopsis sp. NPDC051373]|uniref:hypothetical protein n=1 Tax=Amycolatopsis sp. NPDC051373 TaxID=3155801 RepID=UPI00344B72B3